VLDFVMRQNERIKVRSAPKLFDVVGLLSDSKAAGIAAGAIGTIVEELPGHFYIVEFTDADGKALAVATLPASDLTIQG
jgi:hypothetical protein